MKTTHLVLRSVWLPSRAAFLLVCALFAVPGVSLAEVSEVRVAQQFGMNYLPLIVMKKHSLIEKHAEKAGLGNIKVSWLQFGAGAAMNDALISSNLDFASGGVGPLLKIWDKTKGNLGVRGVGSLGSMPLYLNTINPSVASIKDFTNKDKIALPAVRVSIQAVVLQMAAERAFGNGNHQKLDKLTVSMKHPDAMAAMLSGAGEITAHFANSPFQEQELQDKRVRRVLSSYEVLGGPSTLNSLYTTSKFRAANPKTYVAVVSALKEAMEIINGDKRAAAQLYVEEEKSRLSPDFVFGILSDPDFQVTVTPQAVTKYAEFLHRTGGINNRPESWKDIYFPEIHDLPGS